MIGWFVLLLLSPSSSSSSSFSTSTTWPLSFSATGSSLTSRSESISLIASSSSPQQNYSLPRGKFFTASTFSASTGRSLAGSKGITSSSPEELPTTPPFPPSHEAYSSSFNFSSLIITQGLEHFKTGVSPSWFLSNIFILTQLSILDETKWYFRYTLLQHNILSILVRRHWCTKNFIEKDKNWWKKNLLQKLTMCTMLSVCLFEIGQVQTMYVSQLGKYT